MTLLHFIALTVKEKYPELANFWQELHFVEKAAAGEGPPASSLGQSQEAEQEEHLCPFLAFVIFLTTSKLSAQGPLQREPSLRLAQQLQFSVTYVM